jgi:hypothetical protein
MRNQFFCVILRALAVYKIRIDCVEWWIIEYKNTIPHLKK